MAARSDRSVDPVPTGECWCGCGESTSEGNFFLPGHDKVAESAVINVEYGSVASFLVEHDYGPAGKHPRHELENWQRSGRATR